VPEILRFFFFPAVPGRDGEGAPHRGEGAPAAFEHIGSFRFAPAADPGPRPEKSKKKRPVLPPEEGLRGV